MKEKTIIWVFIGLLTIIVVFDTFRFWSIENRIEKLEEKAKHFRCLEERISKIGHHVRIMEKNELFYCPFCEVKIDSNLVHTCWTTQ